MSFRDQISILARLQHADLAARRLQAEIERMPAAREACKQRVAAAEQAVLAAEGDREESLKHHRKLEGDLQDAEGRVDKYREQELMVKTNEQLWALQAEMRQAQDAVGTLETSILEEMERADSLQGQIAERRAEQQEAERVTAAEIVDIDSRETAVRSELDEALRDIEALRRDLDDELAALYDRVKKARGGVAVAEGIDSTCQGCNVRLRPQVWLHVLNMEEPVQCDNCKRIIFSRDVTELPSTVQVTVAE